MPYAPISLSTQQYVDGNGAPYSGAVLKAYSAGTSSNITMATDSTGSTTFTSVALNSSGYPEHSGEIVIPHVSENYKLSFYANQTAADADSGALWSIDNLMPVTVTGQFSTNDAVSSGITSVITLTHTTNGTPVAGIGTGVSYITETASDNYEVGMIAGSEASDVSAGTEDFDFVVKLMAGGSPAAEKFRVTSAGVLSVATLSPTNALAVTKGGTGGTTAAEARTNLDAQVDLDVVSQVDAEAGTATDERIWTAERVKQAIDALGGVGFNYKAGLILSNDADTDHDINVTAGVAIDSTNTVTMTLASEMTKRLDATWAAGDDEGGLSSSLSALANNTWYHIFEVIIGGSVDILADTSVTCSNGVTDHSVTSYRWIGAVLTDGSADIIAFQQRGDVFQWDPPLAIADSNTGTSAVLAAIAAPLGVETEAFGGVSFTDSTSTTAGVLISSPNVTDQGTNNPLGNVTLQREGTFIIGGTWSAITDTSSRIRYRCDTDIDTLNISVSGWRAFF